MAKRNQSLKLVLIVGAVLVGAWLLFKGWFGTKTAASSAATAVAGSGIGTAGIMSAITGFGSSIAGLFSGSGSAGSNLSSATSNLSTILGSGTSSDTQELLGDLGDDLDSSSMVTSFDNVV